LISDLSSAWNDDSDLEIFGRADAINLWFHHGSSTTVSGIDYCERMLVDNHDDLPDSKNEG
jgi:hypothetical protein